MMLFSVCFIDPFLGEYYIRSIDSHGVFFTRKEKASILFERIELADSFSNFMVSYMSSYDEFFKYPDIRIHPVSIETDEINNNEK